MIIEVKESHRKIVVRIWLYFVLLTSKYARRPRLTNTAVTNIL